MVDAIDSKSIVERRARSSRARGTTFDGEARRFYNHSRHAPGLLPLLWLLKEPGETRARYSGKRRSSSHGRRAHHRSRNAARQYSHAYDSRQRWGAARERRNLVDRPAADRSRRYRDLVLLRDERIGSG